MNIPKVDYLTFNKLYSVMNATHITQAQKEDFLRANSVQIHQLMADKINAPAFKAIMKNRPLKLFKPVKNSFTKAGDKKILAELLGIEPCDVADYVSMVAESAAAGDLKNLSRDKIETVMTYAYRHGKKQDVINFLDFQLSSAADTLDTLYQTLSYDTNGAADYFIRPIHRLDDDTMIKMYDVINKNLDRAKSLGSLTDMDKKTEAEWALVRIYEIQNNQQLKNAIKLKHKLESGIY